jgi:hypothetical protein
MTPRFWFLLTGTVCLAAPARQWSVHELRFEAANDVPNAYVATRFDARFTSPAGEVFSVPGFFDGGRTFRIRFTPTRIGRWTYATSSSEPSLDGRSGSFEATPPGAGAHGFLRRDRDNPHHFVWDDGTRYWMLGQTYYELISNARNSEAWRKSIDENRRAGINKIRFRLHIKTCATQDNPFPCDQWWLGDKDHLDLRHFQALDRIVEYLAGNGMVADLLPFDSAAVSYGTPEQDERFLRYVVARYAAYPNVIWCVTNEWQRAGRPKEYLAELGRKLRDLDPWSAGRPLSIHPLGGKGNGERFQFGDQTWPVHVILQTGRGDPADPQLHADMLANREFGKPVVNDEFGYMGDALWWGSDGKRGGYSRAKHRQALWAIYMAGAYASIGDKYLYDDGRPYKSAMWHRPVEYDDVVHMARFFQGVPYWRLKPAPALADRVYTLSEPGSEYVFYAATGTAFSTALEPGTYSKVRLYDPRTGSAKSLGTVKGGQVTFEFPDKQDWVIHISR